MATSTVASAPVPGQNVNSKPFTSQLTRTTAPPPQPPVNQPNTNMGGPQRFPTMTFNNSVPPNTVAPPQQFNNKFNNFALQGIGQLLILSAHFIIALL